ncbi:hypothetical protein COB18_00340 [Candidatus Kaiserbacteria bacterium]|nr:MAG: hypothetical protein COB18_00340 [Candidatus Kaiserbacteria bacterium]
MNKYFKTSLVSAAIAIVLAGSLFYPWIYSLVRGTYTVDPIETLLWVIFLISVLISIGTCIIAVHQFFKRSSDTTDFGSN